MIKSGFLFVDKEKGVTCQNLDNKIKKKFDINKVGHLGTLDPLATGLVIIGTLDSTKYFKYFSESRKTYILRLRMGSTTPSLDNETEITESVTCDLRGKEDLIDNALSTYPRVYQQYPPLYSAVKVDGVPLYKYAYKKKDVEINSREVTIYSAKRISNIEYINDNSYVSMEMEVSKGFYIRSFARDFAVVFGYPGMADEIRRTKVDDYSLDRASTIDALTLDSFIDPLTLLDFKRIEINNTQLKSILNGAVYHPNEALTFPYIILSHNGEDLAIYKKAENNNYRMDLLIKR